MYVPHPHRISTYQDVCLSKAGAVLFWTMSSISGGEQKFSRVVTRTQSLSRRVGMWERLFLLIIAISVAFETQQARSPRVSLRGCGELLHSVARSRRVS